MQKNPFQFDELKIEFVHRDERHQCRAKKNGQNSIKVKDIKHEVNRLKGR